MVDKVALFGVVQFIGQIHAMILPEIIRQIRPGHQVKPGKFHTNLLTKGLHVFLSEPAIPPNYVEK
jgi:hypothetical protein